MWTEWKNVSPSSIACRYKEVVQQILFESPPAVELRDRKWLNKHSHDPPLPAQVMRRVREGGRRACQPHSLYLSKIQGELCGERDDRDRPKRKTESGLRLGAGPRADRSSCHWELLPTSPLREEVAHTKSHTQTKVCPAPSQPLCTLQLGGRQPPGPSHSPSGPPA